MKCIVERKYKVACVPMLDLDTLIVCLQDDTISADEKVEYAQLFVNHIKRDLIDNAKTKVLSDAEFH